MRRRLFLALQPALLAAATLAACGRGEKPAGAATEIVVAAAASLREVLEAAAPAFQAEHPGTKVRFSFEASSTLARQIQEGAAFDAFLSADEPTLQRVRSALDPGTIMPFLSNRLAMVVRQGLPNPPKTPAELVSRTGSIALAGPEVPAGRYARDYLERAGIFGAVEKRIANTSNVRAALALVESWGADYALVYATDARAAKTAQVAWTAGSKDFPPTLYVGAALARAPKTAGDYVRFLTSPAFLDVAESYGFQRPP